MIDFNKSLEEVDEIYFGELNNEDFLRLQQGEPGRYPLTVGNPNVCLTSGVGQEAEISIIQINEYFLPMEQKLWFARILVFGELSKFKIYQNSDRNNEEYEAWERGDNSDLKAHQEALKQELEFANAAGMLEEYQEHWLNWLKDISQQENDLEIQKIIDAKIQMRKLVYQEVKNELSGETRESGSY